MPLAEMDNPELHKKASALEYIKFRCANVLQLLNISTTPRHVFGARQNPVPLPRRRGDVAIRAST